MCIWKVEPEDRHCQYCSYILGCEKRLVNGKRIGESEYLEEYLMAMSAEVGANILEKSRRARIVWGRYLLAYQLSLDGFSDKSIGNMVGLDRTTVIHAMKEVKKMIKSPWMYPSETEMWINFKTRINQNNNEQVYRQNQEVVAVHDEQSH